MRTYGDKVYIRGIINLQTTVKETAFTVELEGAIECKRYRLTLEDIEECVEIGDKLGYKTYVLQGGGRRLLYR